MKKATIFVFGLLIAGAAFVGTSLDARRFVYLLAGQRRGVVVCLYLSGNYRPQELQKSEITKEKPFVTCIPVTNGFSFSSN